MKLNNEVAYKMALLIKERMEKVIESRYDDFSPLAPLLAIDEKSLNKILSLFKGEDNSPLYYQDGEFHYMGRELDMPKTGILVGLIQRIDMEIIE